MYIREKRRGTDGEKQLYSYFNNPQGRNIAKQDRIRRDILLKLQLRQQEAGIN